MQQTIYFIDYYNDKNDNGLTTYTNHFISFIKQKGKYKLKIFWVNSTEFKSTTKISNGDICHIHIPFLQKNSPELTNGILVNLIQEEVIQDKEIIIHLNWISHLGLSWQIKQKINCKIILTKHCIPWRDFVTTNYNLFRNLNNAYIKRQPVLVNNPQLKKEIIGYDNVDHVICVTNSAKTSLKNIFKINENKISVVYNGLNLKKNNQKTKTILRERYHFEESDIILLYAGKICHSKGVFNLVKLFDDLINQPGFENLRLVIAGSGDYSTLLKSAIKNWAKITVTGNLDKTTLQNFYNLSDIGIIPSFAEQCSYTCIEMMQNGLPIMVSDLDGLKEMVNDECGLKIKIDFKEKGASINAKDFKNKLSFYLQNPKEAERLALNAKEYALQHFTAERMVGETVEVYKKVLHCSKAETIKSDNENGAPFVSIILPCYNEEKYLEDCLKSVFAQDYVNFELIIIDDGSTDQTNDVINSIKDIRIVYLKNDVNKGITYSLNKAIKRAKGKYICRIDADDKMVLNRLKSQIEFLENNQDYGMVGGWMSIIESSGMPISRIELPIENADLKLAMLFYNPFAHSTVTIRTEIVKKIKYNNSFKYCEDYDLWFRIGTRSKVKNLPLALVEYRVHSKNSSINNKKVMQQNVIQLLSRELDNLGIVHTLEELVLHSALGFGYGLDYFNTTEKLAKLNCWLDKLFAATKLIEAYGDKRLKLFRKELLVELNLS